MKLQRNNYPTLDKPVGPYVHAVRVLRYIKEKYTWMVIYYFQKGNKR